MTPVIIIKNTTKKEAYFLGIAKISIKPYISIAIVKAGVDSAKIIESTT